MAIERLQINGLAVDHAAASGPRMVFVHGSNGGAWYWEAFLGYFAERGYDCFAPSLRGHPPNPPLADLGQVSLHDYVDDIKGVLQELGEDVILVGHSMGGAIAQVVAQDAALRAAVFAASAPVAGVKFRHPPFNIWFTLHGLKSIPALLRKKTLAPGFRVARDALFNRIPPDRQHPLWARLSPESARVAVEVVRGSVAADLSQVAFPMLTMVGSEDQTTVPEMEREIAAQHGTDFLELPGHGHMFMLEPGWEDCAARLGAWLVRRGLAG